MSYENVRQDRIPMNTPAEAKELPECQEMLSLYKKSYDQLAILKHLAYSSLHLSDPESLAVLFSKQIDEKMPPKRNTCWLVDENRQVVEVASDGKLVEKNKRRVLAIDSSDVLKRVIYDQMVVWPSGIPDVKELLPGYDSPTIFPIKSQPEAYGFLALDPNQSTEVELYQFVSQFAAMIIKMSKLHQKVDQQREELDEMTGILFRQNAHLSSLYHVELDLMKVTDPVQLCRIVVDAVVNDLEAHRAAAFLVDEPSQELIGAYASGGLEGIETLRFPIEREKPIKQAYESGRVINCIDYPEEFHLGPNLLENWIVSVFKGRERVQGILVVEVMEEGDLADPISILANYSGILLDTLMLQRQCGI